MTPRPTTRSSPPHCSTTAGDDRRGRRRRRTLASISTACPSTTHGVATAAAATSAPVEVDDDDLDPGGSRRRCRRARRGSRRSSLDRFGSIGRRRLGDDGGDATVAASNVSGPAAWGTTRASPRAIAELPPAQRRVPAPPVTTTTENAAGTVTGAAVAVDRPGPEVRVGRRRQQRMRLRRGGVPPAGRGGRPSAVSRASVRTASRATSKPSPRWPSAGPSMSKPSHSSRIEKSVGSCSSTTNTPASRQCGVDAGTSTPSPTSIAQRTEQVEHRVHGLVVDELGPLLAADRPGRPDEHRATTGRDVEHDPRLGLAERAVEVGRWRTGGWGGRGPATVRRRRAA